MEVSEKVQKHENIRTHMENPLKLADWRLNFDTQMDDGHMSGMMKLNEDVDDETGIFHLK